MMYGDEYSQDGGWRAEGTYGNRMRDSYRRGNSYANREGSHYVRGHYSMTDGRDYLMSQMNDMMEDGSLSSQSRNALRRAMETLQNE